MSFIQSPNTVLANSLVDALDIIRPRLEINKPNEVVFSVGSQLGLLASSSTKLNGERIVNSSFLSFTVGF